MHDITDHIGQPILEHTREPEISLDPLASHAKSASVTETEQNAAVTSTSNAIETYMPKSSDLSQTNESRYPTRDHRPPDWYTP